MSLPWSRANINSLVTIPAHQIGFRKYAKSSAIPVSLAHVLSLQPRRATYRHSLASFDVGGMSMLGLI